jgi:hypothetical protein
MQQARAAMPVVYQVVVMNNLIIYLEQQEICLTSRVCCQKPMLIEQQYKSLKAKIETLPQAF